MANNRQGKLAILPPQISPCSSTPGLFARDSHAAQDESIFIRLLAAVVNAEPGFCQQTDETRLAAITILKRHSELLFQIGTVTDHFGRKIEASPYRLFLGTGDTWALREIHASIIPMIKNGEAIAEAQFKAQFPHCPWPCDPNMDEEALYDDRNRAQIAQVIAQLKVIVERISADPCTHGQATKDETTKAAADLYQIFKPKEAEVIQTGLHFPLGMMKEIYEVYDAQFNLWCNGQSAFFSRTVIGAAEAALTAVDGQCCKNGLENRLLGGNLDMEKGPDRRDGLFCRRSNSIPQALAPIGDKLGRTMFVDPLDGSICSLSSRVGSFAWYDKNGTLLLDNINGRAGMCSAYWKTLWRTKAAEHGSLRSHTMQWKCVLL